MAKSESESSSNKFKTLATVQPISKVIDPYPMTLKYFPLRRTVKLFAIADALMASMLLISRYFIATRIVTYPIFALVSTSLYILISCFGIFQVFTVRSIDLWRQRLSVYLLCVGEYQFIPILPISLPNCYGIKFSIHNCIEFTNI